MYMKTIQWSDFFRQKHQKLLKGHGNFIAVNYITPDSSTFPKQAKRTINTTISVNSSLSFPLPLAAGLPATTVPVPYILAVTLINPHVFSST
jgi:hypothetical protein